MQRRNHGSADNSRGLAAAGEMHTRAAEWVRTCCSSAASHSSTRFSKGWASRLKESADGGGHEQSYVETCARVLTRPRAIFGFVAVDLILQVSGHDEGARAFYLQEEQVNNKMATERLKC